MDDDRIGGDDNDEFFDEDTSFSIKIPEKDVFIEEYDELTPYSEEDVDVEVENKAAEVEKETDSNSPDAAKKDNKAAKNRSSKLKVYNSKNEKKKKRLIFAAAVILLAIVLMVLAFIIVQVISNIADNAGSNASYDTPPYTSSATDIKLTMNSAELVEIGDNFFTVTSESITCYGSDGVYNWDKNITNIADKKIMSGKKYIVIYDRVGALLMLFSEKGLILEKGVDGTIDTVVIDEKNGLIAIVYKDSIYKNCVLFCEFNDKGNVDDVFVKKFASQSVISAAISPDGKSLALCGISAEEAQITGIISLINTKTGDGYYTGTFSGKYYPLLGFVGNDVLSAVSDTGAIYIKNSMAAGDGSANVSIVASPKSTASFIAVCAGQDGVLAISEGSGDGAADVMFFGGNGKKLGNVSFPDNVIGIRDAGKMFLAFTGDLIELLNYEGKVLGVYDKLHGIKNVKVVNDTTFVVYYDSGIANLYFEKAGK